VYKIVLVCSGKKNGSIPQKLSETNLDAALWAQKSGNYKRIAELDSNYARNLRAAEAEK